MELQLLNLLQQVVSRPAGTFTVPPAGVYTHAVLWAKNLMGVKNFVQVDLHNWISIGASAEQLVIVGQLQVSQH